MPTRKYIIIDGETFECEFYCIIEKEYANKNRDGKTWVYVKSNRRGYIGNYHLSVYYRHERTWDDHMGNTPCGYYVIVPFPGGKRKRVYMY